MQFWFYVILPCSFTDSLQQTLTQIPLFQIFSAFTHSKPHKASSLVSSNGVCIETSFQVIYFKLFIFQVTADRIYQLSKTTMPRIRLQVCQVFWLAELRYHGRRKIPGSLEDLVQNTMSKIDKVYIVILLIQACTLVMQC
ncbi:Hypothetical_protein [Hexamita inflata]|uniref:Hypothetical_protein n=1 Tax=Hexamita inflata TaxID=28002 RepID=A0AA86N8N1_9EUKA|nr:Hypothetical protein HINF_LOCUS2679 [Hexamita inflata]